MTGPHPPLQLHVTTHSTHTSQTALDLYMVQQLSHHNVAQIHSTFNKTPHSKRVQRHITGPHPPLELHVTPLNTQTIPLIVYTPHRIYPSTTLRSKLSPKSPISPNTHHTPTTTGMNAHSNLQLEHRATRHDVGLKNTRVTTTARVRSALAKTSIDPKICHATITTIPERMQ